ncbi:MAG: hypothetical protein HQL56_16310 [Magnetococcales bacterium]|nr:hypothetical protein [Magnetococcales bacterium]
MRRFVFLTLSALMFVGTLQAQEPDRQRVMNLLAGYEWRLIPERWQQLGGDADLILMEVVTDPQLMNVYRFRAMEVLTLYPTNRVADFLERFTLSATEVPLLWRSFRSMERSFKTSQPDRVARLATQLLQHPNARVREDAARTLGELGRQAF